MRFLGGRPNCIRPLWSNQSSTWEPIWDGPAVLVHIHAGGQCTGLQALVYKRASWRASDDSLVDSDS